MYIRKYRPLWHLKSYRADAENEGRLRCTCKIKSEDRNNLTRKVPNGRRFGQESIAHFILVCNIKKYFGCQPFYWPAEIIEFRQHIIVFRLHQTYLFHYVYGERNSDGANSFSVVKGVYLQNPGMHSKHVILNWYFKTLMRIVLLQ